jgi:small GTP-binding protein
MDDNTNKNTPPATTSTYKREKPNKVVIIGDSNVGKTCFIERYCEDRFGDTQPTIGALHKIKTVDDIQLDIWDTAGQERFKSMVPMYYKGAKAIIVAFDITSVASFDGAKRWLNEIESSTANMVIILLANKIDLEKRMISKETAKNFADGKNIAYFESSAKENLNVKEVFEFIAGKIKESNFKSNNAINIKDEKKLNGETKTCGCV